MFKVNDRNTRMRWVIGSKLAVRTPERCQYFTPCSNVSVVNFEQVNVGWVNWNINTPILRSIFILKYFDWKTPGKQEVLFLSYQIFRIQFYINITFFWISKIPDRYFHIILFLHIAANASNKYCKKLVVVDILLFF